MITKEIKPGLLNEALRHSKERLQFEFNRFNLSIEKRKSMILIGTIGQLIFKEFLEKRKIKFEFEYQAGNYDNLDFKVNNEIIEIKTSGYDYKGFKYLNLLYSLDQFEAGKAKGFKYCVQIFINGYSRKEKLLNYNECNLATIAGYINFNSISNYRSQRRFYGDDFKVPLQGLSSINKLIN